MDKNVVIRKAEPQDATGIAIVRAYTWATAYKGLIPDAILQDRIDGVYANAGRLKKLIEKGQFDYAVAVHNSAVVGFVSYGQSRNKDYAQRGETGALYVLKGFSRMGTGRRLLEFAQKELAEKGFRRMIINCLEGNPSYEFYLHMGGRPIGKRTDEIYGGFTIAENILLFDL